jgi:hypothetical protein
LSALLAPIVAIVATYIAIQQYRTTKLKIRLELFEKRYAVYDGAKMFISLAVRDGTLSDEAFFSLNETTQDAFFLFDDSVDQYIQLLREKGAKLKFLNDRLADQSLPIGEERSSLSAEDADLCTWSGHQFADSKRAFKKYLRVL